MASRIGLAIAVLIAALGVTVMASPGMGGTSSPSVVSGNLTVTGSITTTGVISTSGDVIAGGDVRSTNGNFINATSNATTTLRGKINDAASAVATSLTNANTLTQGADRFVTRACRDQGCSDVVWRVNTAGGVQLNVESASEPTCNAAARGTIHYKPGGAGVADKAEICSKSSGDVYAWRDLATPET